MRGLGLVVLALLGSSAHGDDVSGDEPAATDLPATAAADALDGGDPADERGPVIFIEAIAITGNTSTQDEIIRRALPIAPGDVLYATDKRLRDARFKLLALGYFREVAIAMRRGGARGRIVIEVAVVERGTFVLNKLWFGRTRVAPYWFGVDVGERNLIGLGVAIGGGVVYAAPSAIAGSRDQWAGELRIADGSLRGTRWGANASLTLVHGSDIYRTSGADREVGTEHFRGFAYRRFGGRGNATYDLTALTRLSAGARIEAVNAALPAAPTRTLPDGRVTAVDLQLDPGDSRIVTASLGLDRDTRPDPILPHSGGRLTAAFELGTAALAGDYDFATLFARYEHWWPLRDERHAIGARAAGGIVIGNAPRFDRIYIADVDRMLTPRALGLVLSNAAPLDVLGTADDKATYGELGGLVAVEYAARLFRGPGRRRVYGGDLFVGTGLWGLAQTADVQRRDRGVWRSLPVDLYIDAGVRVDTDLGIFELTVANALGRLR